MEQVRIWDTHGLPKLKAEFFAAVVKDRQMTNIDGHRVDMFSASAVCTVLNNIQSPEIKEKFLALPVDRMVHKAFAVIARVKARSRS